MVIISNEKFGTCRRFLGIMNSGKTEELIKYSKKAIYIGDNVGVIFFKPKIDKRTPPNIIKAKSGEIIKTVIPIKSSLDLYQVVLQMLGSEAIGSDEKKLLDSNRDWMLDPTQLDLLLNNHWEKYSHFAKRGIESKGIEYLVLVVDEDQFLDDGFIDFVRFVQTTENIHLVSGGLDRDFRGEYFTLGKGVGSDRVHTTYDLNRTVDLHIPLEVVYCQECADDATHSQRYIKRIFRREVMNDPAEWSDSLIVVGDTTQTKKSEGYYQSVCERHKFVPGKFIPDTLRELLIREGPVKIEDFKIVTYTLGKGWAEYTQEECDKILNTLFLERKIAEIDGIVCYIGPIPYE